VNPLAELRQHAAEAVGGHPAHGGRMRLFYRFEYLGGIELTDVLLLVVRRGDKVEV